MARARILLIDGDASLRQGLELLLGRAGFDARAAGDAATGLARAQEEPPDLIVLDVVLPDLDGYAVCRRVRAVADVPVVFLTARDGADDRLRGFEAGADDYVVKPFNPRELVARLRALLRRTERARRLLDEDRALLTRIREASAGTATPRSRSLSSDLRVAGPVVLHVSKQEAVVGGRAHALSAAEYRVLERLMSQHGRVVTRTELVAAVWGDGGGGGALLETVVRSLREKLEVTPEQPEIILNIPGIGYQLA